jgi:hypothetical protein
MLDLATALYNEGVTAEVYFHQDSASMSVPEREKATQYFNDRYKKAQTVLDLMIEKLPVYTAPYGISMGLQIADIYARLGSLTDNKADIERAQQILLDEINLYKQYLIYFQTLTPAQFSTLTRTDRYIYDSYFLSLVQGYSDAGGDANELLKQLQAEGVNLSRFFRQEKVSAQEQQQVESEPEE